MPAYENIVDARPHNQFSVHRLDHFSRHEPVSYIGLIRDYDNEEAFLL